jgi:L-phenylalanine/L-methionine N-acetyltransferase
MPDIEIRPVRVEDTEQINVIRRQPEVMDNTLALPSERIAYNQHFIEALGPDDHMFVAVVDGQVAGMAGLHVAPGRRRHAGSVGISIHRDYQGQGIGRALMQALLNLADGYLGLLRVELEVFVDNTRAIKLYESLGFVTEGRKCMDSIRRGEYVDTLVMGRVHTSPPGPLP